VSASPDDDSSASSGSIIDDSSLRLGISRISVEQPEAVSLSFRNDASRNQDSDPFDNSFQISPIRPNENSAISLGSKSNSVLSSLRQSPSMLDAVPSDEMAAAKIQANEGGTRAAWKNSSRKPSAAQQPHPPVEIATKRNKMVSPRSKNETFNRIFSKFEEKPALPIVPPNDTWQYSGSNPNPGAGSATSPRFA
jgi:hypothetical protein